MSLLRCTHFLTQQHILHTTNYYKVIDLIISCGGEDLKNFSEKAGRNASYKSTDAVFDFVAAIGTWVESLNSNFFIRQISLVYWQMNALTLQLLRNYLYAVGVENGESVEHLLEVIPSKRTDAQSIYSILIDCLKEKNIQISKLVGMEQQLFLGRTQGFKQE